MSADNLVEFLLRHFRVVMGIIGAVIALCVGALIALPFSLIKPEGTFLEINVAPGIATISINGRNYRNGIYEFEPGSYDVEIAAEGFTPKTLRVEVEKGKTARVSEYLVNIDEGFEYFERSEADLRLLEAVDDPDVANFLEAYDRKLSIRKQLPIDASYNVPIPGYSGNNIYSQTITDGSYDARCEKAFCLLATGIELNENALSEAVGALGYNINDYEVIYDFEG